jgi:hypothetical protein
MPKKSKMDHPVAIESDDHERLIEEFADFAVETLNEGYKAELEPFEVYAQKLRSQIHSNETAFRLRFIKGYQVLLQELQQHHKK